MEVCLINALFPPHHHGGAENYVYRTATELQERGHKVSILTTKPYDGVSSLRPTCNRYEGLDVWRFYPMNVSHRGNETGSNIVEKAVWHQLDTVNPHAVWAVGRTLDSIDPDIVHTNNLVGISPAIGQALRRRNVGHLHTLHDYSLLCPKSNLLRDLTAPDGELVVCQDPPTPCQAHAEQKRRLLGSPDLVTGPSQHVIDVHHNHGFFDGVPSERLRLGVDEYADKPPEPTNEPSFLFVGKQLNSKGLDILFDATEQCPDIRVDICGSGPYAAETQRVADELENLEYHGFVKDEELTQLRQTATAAVVPSVWMENSPLTIYESFAAGLPVVGSDIGGIPELVDESRGRLFPPGDADRLAAVMRELSSNESEIEPMRKSALSWATTHTLEQHVGNLLDLYNQTLD